MNHRTLKEIFPPYYPSVPDSEEIMRRCVAHFHSAEVPEDLIRWIQQMPCPYLREAYVEGMRTAILNGVEQGDDSFRMNANVREEIELLFVRAIRQARVDQIAEEMIHTDMVINRQNGASPDDLTHVSHLQQTVTQLAKEVREMKQTLTDMNNQTRFDWPYYTSSATTKDKTEFEQTLRTYCQSKTKGKSHDVKMYLALKEKENIIVLPQYIKSEHRILHDYFDYKPNYSAYNNA